MKFHAAVAVLTLAVTTAASADSTTTKLAMDSAPTYANQSLAAGRPAYRGSNGHIQLSPPRVDRAPVIDGRLDDEVWQQAAVLDSFTHGRPIEGVRDSLGTTCLVMYDGQNLYIGFRALDDPKLVQAPIVPRDQTWQGDWVGVSIDSYHDRQRSMFLCANPLGIQMDGIDREGGDSDMAPDFQYTSTGHVTENGYEVEMVVPFKSLRFPNHNPVTFGFNAIRDVKRNGAHMYWAPIRRDINSYHSQLGALENIQGVRPGRNLELNPTMTGSQQGVRDAGAIRYADPESRTGLGMKLGITSNLIADVAVTPDFSQVEADAGVVDINERFAIFYPEKRPFFLEGGDYFNTPFSLLYTRRIVDPLYGGKLTGKTGRTTVGLLHAQDRSASRDFDGFGYSNPYSDRDAMFNVARFKQDLLKNSNVGLLIADREHRDAFNRLAGVDGRFSFKDKYSATFQAVQSWSRDPDLSAAYAALTPAEQATVDPSYLGLAADQRQGTAWMMGGAFDTRPLNTGFEVSGVSPSFAADMGFIQRTNFVSFSGWFRPHLWSKGKTWYNAVHVPTYFERIYDYGGGHMIEQVLSQVAEVNLPLNTGFGGEYVNRFIEFNGVQFEGINRGALWGWCERYKTVRAGITLVAGDQVVFAETLPGHDRRVSIWSDLRFSTQFDGSFNVDKRTVFRQNGTKFADAIIPRLRLSYQFNKEIALRWITELRDTRRFDPVSGTETSRSQSVVPDVLLSYVLRPGTVFYLGYGSQLVGRDTESLTPQQSNLFTKVSYLWQL